jgi:hypothetical protein
MVMKNKKAKPLNFLGNTIMVCSHYVHRLRVLFCSKSFWRLQKVEINCETQNAPVAMSLEEKLCSFQLRFKIRGAHV